MRNFLEASMSTAMGEAGDRAGGRTDAIVVGGGASGALMALHLLRGGDSPIHVTLIENNPRIGRGIAYATANESHLLNIPAGAMSAIDGEPDHFCEWLCRRPEQQIASASPEATRCTFAQRTLYGEYLASLLAPYAAPGERQRRLSIVPTECVSIEDNRASVTAILADGARHSADFVVLATGHEVPTRRGRHYANPWTPPRDAGIEPHHRVLLVGTGLTMVDYVLSLEDAGHCTPIVAVSRRGLLPLAHRPATPVAFQQHEIPFGAGASVMLQWMRERAAAHTARGGDWREVFDGIRPFNQQIWSSLSPSARQQFLRHARPWWGIHRHRIAPQVEARIADALRSGRLVVMAAKVSDIGADGGGARVTYRRRGKFALETMQADKIVDCSGVVFVPYQPTNPAVRDLLARGHAQLDPLQIGLDVAADGAIVDRSGRASQRLFALGPLARAALWEITAIPEIRAQCARLAERMHGARLRRAG
jgi:uncharacterized NAD(P)/FAD-binding protein YdhS